MIKRIAAFLCALAAAFSLAGCEFKPRNIGETGGSSGSSSDTAGSSVSRPSDSSEDKGGSSADEGDEEKTIAVNDKIELYSCAFRSAESQAQTAAVSYSFAASSSAAYLRAGDPFYIDVTLIDLEDSVDFIYTVIINGVKYRYSDGHFGNTQRNRSEKTVSFSVLLEYDGETDTYGIDDIVIMSDLAIRYYVTIGDEYKPVVLPTRAGSGTVEDPYLVYNAAMLLEMTDYPAGTCFRQANDIDLSAVDTGEKYQGGYETVLDRWKPLGSFSRPFECNYDGNGFKITRLSIQRFDMRYSGEAFGLFGYALGCEISNVILEDYRVEVRFARSVGALVGFAQDCTVTNCKLVQGRKENFESGSWSFSNMGGLIGFANECSVANCSVTSDLGLYGSSSDEYPSVGMLGGVVGELRASFMFNCSFSGSMECGIVAGGVVGRCDLAMIVCCESDAVVTASLIAGGLVGQMWRSSLVNSAFGGRISYPLNAAMASPGTAYFGGLVGDAGLDYPIYSDIVTDGEYIASVISECRFTGQITPESAFGKFYTANAGGICARLFDCEISDVEVSAEISGKTAFALAAFVYAAEGFITTAVVGDCVIYGQAGCGILSGGEGTEIYVGSELGDLAAGCTVVSDWDETDGTGAFVLPLSEEVWLLGCGRPTLLLAGALSEDIFEGLDDIFGDLEDIFGDIFGDPEDMDFWA